MALSRVSLMRYQPVPDKEAAFWDWYEHVHTPDLFTRPGWKRVRMCRLLPEVSAPEPLRRYADPTGHPRYLNLLERYAGGPPATPPGSGPSPGQVDMMQNWLPTLAQYDTSGYLCLQEKTAADFGGPPESKGPYRIAVMRYDVTPGKEQAFHQWYDEVHTPELLAQEGLQAVRRYAFSAESRGGPALLQAYQLREGRPAHLILLERDLPQAGPAPSQPAHGVQDFIAKAAAPAELQLHRIRVPGRRLGERFQEVTGSLIANFDQEV